MSLEVVTLTGPDLGAAIPELARLRIAVFAEWPYLYRGDEAYEADYLQDFAAAPDALLVAARDAGQIVGAATASPLVAQAPEVRSPFERHGLDPHRLCYFGESVLLPEWRGRGIGHAFFDHREAHARRCGAAAACFGAVIRGDDDPRRPQGHFALDPFWRKRGYAPVPGLTFDLAWQEHEQTDESAHALQVWLSQLSVD